MLSNPILLFRSAFEMSNFGIIYEYFHLKKHSLKANIYQDQLTVPPQYISLPKQAPSN